MPAATWNGLSCRLVLHYDNGFTLFGMAPPQTLNRNQDLPQKSSVFLWHYSFEQLESSADDGIRMLLLHFSDDRGVVRLPRFGRETSMNKLLFLLSGARPRHQSQAPRIHLAQLSCGKDLTTRPHFLTWVWSFAFAMNS